MTLSEKIIAKINLYNAKVLDAYHSIFGMSGDAYIKNAKQNLQLNVLSLIKTMVHNEFYHICC